MLNPTHELDPRLKGVMDVLGPTGVATGRSELQGHLVDWSGDVHAQALAVLRPGSIAEVQACVRLCREAGLAVVPQGGNTGLVSGAIPLDGEETVIVSLSRLNRIRRIDTTNYSVEVDAGCTLQAVKDACEDSGRFFPLSLGAQGSCQVGGNVATNAGGINVLRYGMVRDLVLGIEAVLPDGRLWNGITGLRKDNRGYDLKQLFIGSEGTLGIVTGVELKLFPRPDNVETAYVGVSSFETAMTLLSMTRQICSDLVTAFEVIGSECMPTARLVDANMQVPVDERAPVHVVLEISSSGAIDTRRLLETLLVAAVEAGVIVDAVIAQSRAQSRSFWAIRENLVEGQVRRGYHVRTDISVRLSEVPAFIAAAREYVAARWPGWISQAYGHAGDGNIHFNVLPPVGLPRSAASETGRDLVAGLYELVGRFSGSISAEHGIGRSRRDVFWAGLSPTHKQMMRAVKEAFDSGGGMNPHCLLPEGGKT